MGSKVNAKIREVKKKKGEGAEKKQKKS